MLNRASQSLAVSCQHTTMLCCTWPIPCLALLYLASITQSFALLRPGIALLKRRFAVPSQALLCLRFTSHCTASAWRCLASQCQYRALPRSTQALQSFAWLRNALPMLCRAMRCYAVPKPCQAWLCLAHARHYFTALCCTTHRLCDAVRCIAIVSLCRAMLGPYIALPGNALPIPSLAVLCQRNTKLCSA